jgi:hypothetical protein
MKVGVAERLRRWERDAGQLLASLQQPALDRGRLGGRMHFPAPLMEEVASGRFRRGGRPCRHCRIVMREMKAPRQANVKVLGPV